MANQMEIGMIESLLISRREQSQQFRGVRRKFLELNDRVVAAKLNHQRAEAAVDSNKQLQNSQFHELSVVRSASPALVPFSTNNKKILLGAILLCGLVMIAPVALLEAHAVKEPAVSATARQLGLPVLASHHHVRLASPPRKPKERTASEEYARVLSLRIQQCVAKPGYFLLFSSMDHGPSPISLLGNLAECFSQRDHRVLLVDVGSDDRHETPLAQLLSDSDRDVQQLSGLSDFLTCKETDISQLTVPSLIPDVDCLLPGTTPAPREGLGTQRFSELCEQMRDLYTLIIVIGPGAHQAVDLEMLAARADGIVFHAASPHNVDARASRVVRHLMDLDAPILGVIG